MLFTSTSPTFGRSWRIRLGIFIWVLALCLAAASDSAAADGQQPVSFNRDIRPILADNCFHCHGPDPGSRKAKLRLDREDGFFAAREDGPTVVKNDPEKSPLYQRIMSDDVDEIMPPPKSHKTLTPAQKALIRRWIAQGAPWQPHWSFIVAQRPELPSVKNEKWVRNPIDRFVLAKLESAGLQPAPEANRHTLARRLSLDITGLPPSPARVEAFVKDASPDAYEKLVDELLASPRYGEHRGRYWLDAARYADTHGQHFDNFRDIWPYRDWVINAFNRNQPFDQFTIEQIAGDLLPNPSQDQLIATGFHRCNMTTNEGGTIAEENLAGYARDRVETTSWVWLGLTANCAVCHDHKFDPITSKDFYSMEAYFRNTTQGSHDGNVRDTAPILPIPMAGDKERLAAIPGEITAAQMAISTRRAMARKEFDAWLATAKVEDAASFVKGDGLLAHLPLNEGKGDQVGNLATKDASPIQSAIPIVWQQGGKLGPAPVIAGESPLALGNIGDFERDQPYSYGAWVNVPKNLQGSAAILARMEGAPGYRGWDLFTYGNFIAAHLIHKWPGDAIKVVTTKQVIKPDTWHHVFVTYDGSSKASGFRIYVDGQNVPIKADVDALKNTTRNALPARIGRRESNAESLNGGAVQDVRIYSRTLGDAEVKSLARAVLLRSLLAKDPKDRTAKEKDELFESSLAGDEVISDAQRKLAQLDSEQKAIRGRSAVAYIQQEKPNSMAMAHILHRGAYDQKREQVEPAVFAALGSMPADAPKNRLGLARWLVATENPMTARVIANRHWQEIFGTGIVKSSEDFGIMGDAPSHPELLDWLAAEFRDGSGDSGKWNVKALIKTIVMSATYRQAQIITPEKLEKDRENRLLSRGPRFRMDAEVLRDHALASSGLLVDKLGGPSVKPYQPDGVWDAVAMPESNTRFYKRDSGEGLYRRSLYTFWKRAAPPASMDIFNAPSREISCIRRERTNTPLQALVTLNDVQFIEAARVLAQVALRQGGDDAAVLDTIAQRVLSRPLLAKERDVVLAMQRDLLSHYKANIDGAKALLAVGDSKADEKIDPSLLAAWTMVCNQMMNLDEMLNK